MPRRNVDADSRLAVVAFMYAPLVHEIRESSTGKACTMHSDLDEK
jgi:hypothetical protein